MSVGVGLERLKEEGNSEERSMGVGLERLKEEGNSEDVRADTVMGPCSSVGRAWCLQC